MADEHASTRIVMRRKNKQISLALAEKEPSYFDWFILCTHYALMVTIDAHPLETLKAKVHVFIYKY